jgi:hypothetical protein
MKIVTSYTYLGIVFHKNGPFNPAIKELSLKPKKAYYALTKLFWLIIVIPKWD